MKKYRLILLSLFCLNALAIGSTSALAESADTQDANAPSLATEPFGDMEAGKTKAAVCGACHGRDGNSGIAMNPKLAGQGAQYIYKQLMDFKSGARSNAIMSGQAAALSEQDAKDIAAFYAAQETSLGTVEKQYLELGQSLYRGGNPETGLPACIACHGPAGKGMSSAGFPALAGQHTQYTKDQLIAFRAAGRGDHKGTKRSDPSVDSGIGMMQSIAAKMTDDEIEAVSSYIFGLR